MYYVLFMIGDVKENGRMGDWENGKMEKWRINPVNLCEKSMLLYRKTNK
jgi:hypothetical protein